MGPFKFNVIGAFLLFLSRTLAVPTGQLISRQDDGTTSPNCSVTPLSLSTIPDLFTLSAFTWGDPTPWTVIFEGGRTDVGYQPIITRNIISEPNFEPSFSFQNGKLAIGPAADKLISYFLSSPSASPSLLEPLCFSNVQYDSKFYGASTCDSKGTTYLELRTYYRTDHHTFFLTISLFDELIFSLLTIIYSYM